MTIKEAINHPNATIIDVRSEGEFAGGHVTGSVNIPLQTVPDEVEAIKAMPRPIVLCLRQPQRPGSDVSPSPRSR
ncbi:MAG: rhodanese-like domain-containing protein [Bacteroidota bacterium]